MRRKGRVLALQALYSYDVGGVPLEELLSFSWDTDDTFSQASDPDSGEEAPAVTEAVHDPAVYDFARILVAGTVNHLEEVDGRINAHLSANWKLERISRVSLAILRLSVYSLLYLTDMAPPIVIDEAVALAKDYGSDDSYKFINAVLDNIRKELAA